MRDWAYGAKKKMGCYFAFSSFYRWVKYEEDVEEGGMRWSKPHVASLSLHSLFELRNCLTSGACMLEMDAMTVAQVAGNWFLFL